MYNSEIKLHAANGVFLRHYVFTIKKSLISEQCSWGLKFMHVLVFCRTIFNTVVHQQYSVEDTCTL